LNKADDAYIVGEIYTQ